MKKLMGILVLMFIMVGVVHPSHAAATDAEKKAMADMSRSFAKALKAGDMVALKKDLSKHLPAALFETQLQLFNAHHKIQGGNIIDSIGSTEGTRFFTLDGTVELTMVDGKKHKPVFTFMKEDGTWKLIEFYFKRLQTDPAAFIYIPRSYLGVFPFPEGGQMDKLIIDSLAALGEETNTNKSGPFYQRLTSAFKQSHSPEKILQILEPFRTRKVDLTVVKGFKPVVTFGPAILDAGLFSVKGYVDSKPQAFTYEFKFLYENGGWKIQKFNANIK